MDKEFDLGFEPIAAWLRSISAESQCLGLATALVKAGTSLPGVDRGAVIISEQGQLFRAANAEFPRDLAELICTMPFRTGFALNETLMQEAVDRQDIVVVRGPDLRSAFTGYEHLAISALYVPMRHQDHMVGMLYLEGAAEADPFVPGCAAVASILAAHAATSFESARLLEALRETHKWMTKGQQVGRMGSYRFNTRTLESRGSKEIYEILGLDMSLRPVPFEAYRSRIHPDDLPTVEAAISAALETRAPFRHEYRVVHTDGTVLELLAVGEWDELESGDLELEGIIADVTAARAAERALADANTQLERAAGLANLGEIAGSIVHEINQPLTALIAGAEASVRWLNRDLPNVEEAKASIMRTIESARHAADVVQSLRLLAKRSNTYFLEVLIDEVIEEAMLLARPDLERSGIVLRKELNAPHMLVYGDKVQLQQVALNLVRNATEAMRDVKGRPRVLTIETAIRSDMVCVGVHDTGSGIPPRDRQRLFEALYTTKTSGLGMGLAICRKIIAAHEGKIWLEDNDPHGTSFHFMLPVQCRQD